MVAHDGAGTPVAVWVQLDGTETVTDPRQLLPRYEIAYSVFDTSTLAWSIPATLTHNSHMDALPQLAPAADGTLTAVWLSADPDRFPVAPDEHITIAADAWTSTWDGTSWTAPASILDGIGADTRPALLAGDPAVVAWSGDTDGDSYTAADREIVTIVHAGVAWSSPLTVTQNAQGDVSPQLGRNNSGQPVLVWAREHVTRTVVATETESIDQIYFSTLDGGTWTTPMLAFEAGGIEELALTTTPNADLVLLWQQVTEEGLDIHYAIYDQQANLWGSARALTHDKAAEWALSPGMLPGGRLVTPFLQRSVVTETQTIDLGNGTTITVPMPVLQAANLMVRGHTLDNDLVLTPDDVTLSENNPAPGESVVISATVQNAGDLALGNVAVGFYDGDPAGGGTLIGIQTLPTAVGAGYTATVTLTWTVPSVSAAHALHVIADPLDEIAESDETNNRVSRSTTLPDLTVVGYVAYRDAQMAYPVAVVRNTGVITASGFTVEFRRETITGTVFASGSVAELGPGCLTVITSTWDLSSEAQGSYTLQAVADASESAAESDEGNNWDAIEVLVAPDLVIWSGDVDVAPVDSGTLVSVTVRNWGTYDAESAMVALYEGAVITSGMESLCSWTIANLAVDANTVLTCALDYVPTHLTAIADPSSSITEIDEGNNAATRELQPDLALLYDREACGNSSWLAVASPLSEEKRRLSNRPILFGQVDYARYYLSAA